MRRPGRDRGHRDELTDGNLSRNLVVLEETGYVSIEKGFEGKRPRTWIAITREGAQALADEVGALRQLLAELDGKAPTLSERGEGRGGTIIGESAAAKFGSRRLCE